MDIPAFLAAKDQQKANKQEATFEAFSPLEFHWGFFLGN